MFFVLLLCFLFLACFSCFCFCFFSGGGGGFGSFRLPCKLKQRHSGEAHLQAPGACVRCSPSAHGNLAPRKAREVREGAIK